MLYCKATYIQGQERFVAILQCTSPTFIALVFQDFITIFACLFFYMNFRNNSPSFREKKDIGIFIGIAVNLQNREKQATVSSNQARSYIDVYEGFQFLLC